MNSYDKYDMINGEDTNCTRYQSCDHCDCSDNYYSTLEEDRNFELEQLNSQIESKAQDRKNTPVFSGVLKYFPNALKQVAKCSKAGNDQHNNGEKLFWDRSKSGDELDALTRHLIDHSINPIDDDGQLHLAKVCWRALGALEKYLEGEDI